MALDLWASIDGTVHFAAADYRPPDAAAESRARRHKPTGAPSRT
jgi:hypothetical protein